MRIPSDISPEIAIFPFFGLICVKHWPISIQEEIMQVVIEYWDQEFDKFLTGY